MITRRGLRGLGQDDLSLPSGGTIVGSSGPSLELIDTGGGLTADPSNAATVASQANNPPWWWGLYGSGSAPGGYGVPAGGYNGGSPPPNSNPFTAMPWYVLAVGAGLILLAVLKK